MAHTIVQTEGAPQAIGPYSQAIFAGNFLFTSGQVALDPITGVMVGEGDVEAQTTVALRNLKEVLRAGGCTVSDVVKTTIFLKDMNDFARVNAIYEKAMDGHRPARSTVEVARLPKDALVEIDAVAIKIG
tara:strand:- start:12 stop:401 length:390 start_codon:yes stop_codon:yes gene_type:complete